MKAILQIIKNSFMVDGKESSSRISAYIILFGISLIVITSIIIEIISAIISFSQGLPHVVSNEMIIILGSLLAHHLTLLGINKKFETKYNINKTNNSASFGDVTQQSQTDSTTQYQTDTTGAIISNTTTTKTDSTKTDSGNSEQYNVG